MSKFKKSLFIFRRDLRIEDNTALNAALQTSNEVITCFIFNDAQVGSHNYRSNNGLAFMIESLEELEVDLESRGGRLHLFHGPPSTILKEIVASESVDAVFVNKDYTPFSRERDKELSSVCDEHKIGFKSFSDALLVEPSEFGKSDGTPYTIYTPFFKKASEEQIAKPYTGSGKNFYKKDLELNYVKARSYWPADSAPNRLSKGGRLAALEIVAKLSNFRLYKEERDYPAKHATTILSPHNKFGTVSIRELYWKVADALGKDHTIIRELFWRDFFTHIAWHFPRVFSGAFHAHYDKIDWSTSKKLFELWCHGKTGFPIVDAGMREMVATGFMHNRVRMIVASFLVKDLLLNWRWGEAFFAQHLTEYDPAVNNGSWQWAASTGCDAQPYFRIFNPWLQQERFDSDCVYIKKWIPELQDVSPGEIHSFNEKPLLAPRSYGMPCVDHKKQKVIAEIMFRDAQPKK